MARVRCRHIHRASGDGDDQTNRKAEALSANHAETTGENDGKLVPLVSW